MKRCAQCRQPIHSEFTRLDAGQKVGTALSFDILERDVDLHHPCLGPWMLHNYPWAVKVREREVDA